MGFKYGIKAHCLDNNQLLVNISSLLQLQLFAQAISSIINVNTERSKVILLEGELGSGKTTLVQLILKSLGYNDRVTSPTYSLMNHYLVGNISIYHLDLYRINNDHNLLSTDLIDIIEQGNNLIFIEWGQNKKVKSDLIVQIRAEILKNMQGDYYYGDRELVLQPQSDFGNNIVNNLLIKFED